MVFDPKLGRLTVFLVEPSHTQANAIQSRLKKVGIQAVQHFTDGAAALHEMCRNPPQLAISAMYLGDMTGADLAVAIRTSPLLSEVAYILVTSIEDPKQIDLVRQAGACAILPKPFNTEDLELALNNAVDYLNLSGLNYKGEIDDVRALIVDDSRSARLFLRHALELMGIAHILEADGGAAGKAILASQQVDLVFSDYHMPGMNGLQFLQFIREASWQSSVPVVLVSSERNPDTLAALAKLGVSGICDKPFELAALKSLVEKILNDSIKA